MAWRTGDTYRFAPEEQIEGVSRTHRTPALLGIAAAFLLVGAALMAMLRPSTRGPEPLAQTAPAPEIKVQPNKPLPPVETSVLNDTAPPAIAFSESKPPPDAMIQPATAKHSGPVAVIPALPEPSIEVRNEPPWVKKLRAENDLRQQLLVAPEVNLVEKVTAAPKELAEAMKVIESQMNKITLKIKNDSDAFVKDLQDTRADLAMLPWRMGAECSLPTQQSKELENHSRAIRRALDVSIFGDSGGRLPARRRTETMSDPSAQHRDVSQFWSSWGGLTKSSQAQSVAIPALKQILTAENSFMRASLVEHLSTLDDRSASATIAERAVFDLDHYVRGKAIEALRKRPSHEFAPVLLKAFRYPWAPAAEHAAEAVAILQLKELAPDLLNLLGEPDPNEPFQTAVKGQQVMAVREVVRINHLRNCLLCHAPSTSALDRVRAPIPVPGQPVPSSFAVYYDSVSGSNVVRADITYLKQDFSVMQPVGNPEAWPTNQRYDYLVRVRQLTPQEITHHEKTVGPAPLSDHKEAILYALRAVTGRDAGTSADAWRALLRAMERDGSRAWKAPCRS